VARIAREPKLFPVDARAIADIDGHGSTCFQEIVKVRDAFD
jgi:hypothetical protein